MMVVNFLRGFWSKCAHKSLRSSFIHISQEEQPHWKASTGTIWAQRTGYSAARMQFGHTTWNIVLFRQTEETSLWDLNMIVVSEKQRGTVFINNTKRVFEKINIESQVWKYILRVGHFCLACIVSPAGTIKNSSIIYLTCPSQSTQLLSPVLSLSNYLNIYGERIFHKDSYMQITQKHLYSLYTYLLQKWWVIHTLNH